MENIRPDTLLLKCTACLLTNAANGSTILPTDLSFRQHAALVANAFITEVVYNTSRVRIRYDFKDNSYCYVAVALNNDQSVPIKDDDAKEDIPLAG